MNGHRVGAGQRERLYASTTHTSDESGDLDYIAIEYALNGEPVHLTAAEKLYAAQILDGRGYSDKAIGRHVRCDPSTVAGWRANGWTAGGTHPKTVARRLNAAAKTAHDEGPADAGPGGRRSDEVRTQGSRLGVGPSSGW